MLCAIPAKGYVSVRNPARGALVIAVLAALSEAALLLRVGVPRGPMLLCAVVIALACAALLLGLCPTQLLGWLSGIASGVL